jgi:hypothetical protein
LGLGDTRPEFVQHTAIPQAGGLKRHEQWWIQNCSSSWVLGWIQRGFPLWWKDPTVLPPPFRRRNHKGAFDHAGFIVECIRDLLQAGAARKVPTQPRVVNPLNVTPKKNGKLRLILDLRHVNQFLMIPKFKMDTLSLLSSLANKGDRMFAIDLAHGYHQVQMSEEAQEYLGFEWEGQFYVFTALPFGLASAPWCFTKVMLEVLRVLRSKGIKVIGFLDDFLTIVPRDSARAATIRDVVLNTFKAAGLTINFEKSTLDFTPRLEHLGFVVDLDLGRFEVPPRRWEALQGLVSQVLSARRSQVRTIARVTGHLVSMSLALGPVCRLFTRYCYQLTCQLHMAKFVAVTEEVSRELKFWRSMERTRFTSPIWRDPAVSDLVINTDAGNKSWGAVCDGRVAQGYFPKDVRVTGSCFREILGVYFGLLSFKSLIQGRFVQVRVDNQPLLHMIPGGSMRPAYQRIALKIYWLIESLDARLLLEWVPREENKEADAVTRWFDRDDWQLNPRFFQLADRMWGPHSIDRFAGHNNHLLPVFNSLHFCPGTAGVNALAQSDWGQHNNWCNPPFGLIPTLVAVLRKFKASATVVVPYWPSRPWWPLLLSSPGVFAPFVIGCIQLPRSSSLFTSGPGESSPEGSGAPNWRTMLVRMSFSPDQPQSALVPIPYQ